MTRQKLNGNTLEPYEFSQGSIPETIPTWTDWVWELTSWNSRLQENDLGSLNCFFEIPPCHSHPTIRLLLLAAHERGSHLPGRAGRAGRGQRQGPHFDGPLVTTVASRKQTNKRANINGWFLPNINPTELIRPQSITMNIKPTRASTHKLMMDHAIWRRLNVLK